MGERDRLRPASGQTEPPPLSRMRPACAAPRPACTAPTPVAACSCCHEGCTVEREKLRAKVIHLMNENLAMHEELRRSGEMISQHRIATKKIISSRRLEECDDVFQQNSDLMNLYVASARLDQVA